MDAGRKVEEPWSAYRLCPTLSSDVLDGLSRQLPNLDPAALTRVLMSFLHLKPIQVRDMQLDLGAFIDKCDASLPDDDDHAWARFVARGLKGFGETMRFDVDTHHHASCGMPPYIDGILQRTSSALSVVQPWLLPAEAQYRDTALLPPVASPPASEHFRVRRAYTFDAKAEPHVAHAIPVSRPAAVPQVHRTCINRAPFLYNSCLAPTEQPASFVAAQGSATVVSRPASTGPARHRTVQKADGDQDDGPGGCRPPARQEQARSSDRHRVPPREGGPPPAGEGREGAETARGAGTETTVMTRNALLTSPSCGW